VRTLLVSALLAAIALAPMSGPAAAASITISPASGDQDDTFTVEGEGLQPGLALDVNFVSPSGEVFSTAALNKVVVVDPEGDFAFEVTPSTDFAGQPAGTWTAQVCVTGTDDCVQTTFTISI
jgi:hypothetical protein